MGVPVTLHEMRPARPTAVHKTDRLAELVCSNSFRGDKLDNAVGLLKEEMRRLGSLVMRVADSVRVPAGAALAVDREQFCGRRDRRDPPASADHRRARRDSSASRRRPNGEADRRRDRTVDVRGSLGRHRRVRRAAIIWRSSTRSAHRAGRDDRQREGVSGLALEPKSARRGPGAAPTARPVETTATATT